MKDSKFKITSFKDIEEQDVEWLWRPYLPLGKITIIVGDPGVGKSFITAFLASVVSNGDKFPFVDDNAPLGNVIIQNNEDGVGDTIKKRLMVLGADDEKVHTIELEEEHKDEADLLLKDTDVLDMQFSELNPILVIFDPIQSFLGDIDINSVTKVRTLLKPIGSLAEKHNCAIVLVCHRNKGIQGGSQVHKILGSVDIGGIARSVISVGTNPNNKEEKLFMHTKTNLAPNGQTLAFNITDSGINWLGARGYMIDDSILNQENEPKKSPREIAKEFIIAYLQDNEKSRYDDMFFEAKEQGISEKTLERARDDLKNDNTIDKEYINGKCFWYLIEVSPYPQVTEYEEVGESNPKQRNVDNCQE